MPPFRRDELLQQIYALAQNFIDGLVKEMSDNLIHSDPYDAPTPTTSELWGSPPSHPPDLDDPMSREDLWPHTWAHSTESVISRLSAFMTIFSELESNITHTRVLNPGSPIPNALKGGLDRLWWHKDHRPETFRSFVRVKPATFDELVRRLSFSPEFQNDSNNPQIEVRAQVAIALYRLGHYGNGASVVEVADWAGVAVGSVVNCTRRVILAVLELHDEVFATPSPEMIARSKEFAQGVCSAWAGGFMSVDGSTIPLFSKPGHYGESYFDKTSRYSMNVQVS
jgi:hypothetical protein